MRELTSMAKTITPRSEPQFVTSVKSITLWPLEKLMTYYTCGNNEEIGKTK
jgi:hypothetical protein